MYNIGIIAIIDLFMVGDKNTIKDIFMGTNVALGAWLVYNPGGIFGEGWGGLVGLVTTFACYFTAVAGNWFLEGAGRWAMSPPKFEIFLIFPYFLGS